MQFSATPEQEVFGFDVTVNESLTVDVLDSVKLQKTLRRWQPFPPKKTW
jgi:hypothetical protein